MIKFAELVGIPWYLFADGDDPGRRAVASIFSRHPDTDSLGQSHVVWADEKSDGATERLMVNFDPEVCRAALLLLACELADDATDSDLLTALKATKGSVGAPLAHELLRKYHDHVDWPLPIRTLISRLEGALNPPEDDGDGD